MIRKGKVLTFFQNPGSTILPTAHRNNCALLIHHIQPSIKAAQTRS